MKIKDLYLDIDNVCSGGIFRDEGKFLLDLSNTGEYKFS